MHLKRHTAILLITIFVTVVLSLAIDALTVYAGIYTVTKLLLSIVGLLTSIYLVLYHYLKIPIICPRTKMIDCKKVLDSKYSYIFRVRTSILGIIFFVPEIYVVVIRLHGLYLLLSFIGFLYIIERVYAQSRVGKICIYCTGIYIIITALFFLALLH